MFERLDFEVPRRPDVGARRMLHLWHSQMGVLVSERWHSVMLEVPELKPQSLVPMLQQHAFRELDVDSIGARLEFGDQGIPVVVAMSGRLARVLVENVLNLTSEEWPKSQPFSPGELSILEILFENIADAMGESWPGRDAMLCRFAEILHKPSRTRSFSMNADLLVAKAEVVTLCGSDAIYWFFPKGQVEEIIPHLTPSELIEAQHFESNILGLVKKMTGMVSVQLGTVDVKMSEVSNLALGDVLILGQSVYNPLTAFVEGQPKWKGKPVTVGNRIAFQVSECIAD